jgi:hypothetical protein
LKQKPKEIKQENVGKKRKGLGRTRKKKNVS